MKALHVLMTTAWYPNRKSAADGVFVEQHALAIARECNVGLLMVQTDSRIRGWHIEVEQRRHPQAATLVETLVYVPRIDRSWFGLAALARLMWYAAGTWRGYRAIRHVWRGRRPEVCHVNILTRAAMLPLWLRFRHKIPYIVTEHWSRYGRPIFPHGRFHLWATHLAVRHAAAVCPVSRNLEDNMLRWGLRNGHYVRVGNVVDTKTFRPAQQTAGATHRLVHVSWLCDEAKNISGMLRAMSLLRRHRTDFTLTIVGDGPDRPRLADLARSLGLADCVEFAGMLRGAALADALRTADALVMFSNYENQPVAVLEALACGRPVVATSVGDIPAMLADGRGIVISPRDEDALTKALDVMLDTASSYSPEALHAYVDGLHSPAVVANAFTGLYRQALMSDKD